MLLKTLSLKYVLQTYTWNGGSALKTNREIPELVIEKMLIYEVVSSPTGRRYLTFFVFRIVTRFGDDALENVISKICFANLYVEWWIRVKSKQRNTRAGY